jgi:DNA replication protein DnaC
MYNVTTITLNDLYTNYSRKKPINMFLMGQVGRGKSTWLDYIGRDEGNVTTKKWNEPDLIYKFAEKNYNSEDCTKFIYNRWADFSGYLIIDDFATTDTMINHYGKQINPLDFIIHCMYEAYKLRLSKGYTKNNIVITSNCSLSYLETIISERSFARLLELCELFFIDGDNLRPTRKDQYHGEIRV